jgi:hydroxymethylpyrimidine pyrophosphatase-like HAD family hydrolase
MEKVKKQSTFFVDIDGTIIKYRKFKELEGSVAEPITEVIDFLNSSYDEGSVVIITTARPPEWLEFTKKELNEIGLKYHQIVMGCGRGTRVILNDKDPEMPELPRAVGINLTRNEGFKGVDLDNIISSYESY